MIKEVRTDALRWLDIEHPTKEDIGKLKAEFDFHQLTLEDVLHPLRRPRVDEFGSYLFIVLQFPVYLKKKTVSWAELDIYVGENYLVTIHNGNLELLGDLFDKYLDDLNIRNEIFSKGIGLLLYTILIKLLERGFPILDQLDERISVIEDEIFEREAGARLVIELSLLRRDISNYRRIIGPQRSVLGQLGPKYHKAGLPPLEAYFGDLVDNIEKIWDSLEYQRDITESLYESNFTLLSTQTNDALRILTVMSVIFLPLTLIASIYGMNVPLPFGESRFAFESILLIMLSTVILMLFYFKRRKWL